MHASAPPTRVLNDNVHFNFVRLHDPNLEDSEPSKPWLGFALACMQYSWPAMQDAIQSIIYPMKRQTIPQHQGRASVQGLR